MGDLAASRTMEYLATLRESGRAVPPLDPASDQAILSLAGKGPAHGRKPLGPPAGGNVKTDRRHDRRELEADELRRLLAAARDSEHSFRGLAGRDRYHLYAT